MNGVIWMVMSDTRAFPSDSDGRSSLPPKLGARLPFRALAPKGPRFTDT